MCPLCETCTPWNMSDICPMAKVIIPGLNWVLCERHNIVAFGNMFEYFILCVWIM